jgi:hypothetical protein
MTDTHTTHDDPNAAKQRAEEARQENEKRAQEQRQKVDEARTKAREAGDKLREDERKQTDERLEAARKYQDAKAKEDARRAALSPPERATEDDKRAAMTPEEREKDAEEKGLDLAPGLQDEINLLVATPQFPIQTEKAHSAEFVLSEAAGHGSRDNVTIAIGDSCAVGQTLKIVTPATLTVPAVVTGNVTTDVAADAIALYAVPVSTVAQNVAVISRNAEVNGNLLYFPGTILAADKNNIAKALAVHNIMARF